MGTQGNFRAIVEPIIDRYKETSLVSRWQEAITYDLDPSPLAFWIRESDDLVNIVWLTRKDVRDITWFPNLRMSTFNILPISYVAGLEVREATDAAKALGFPVTGNYVIRVYSHSPRGGLVWATSSEKEIAKLREFVSQLLRVVQEG